MRIIYTLLLFNLLIFKSLATPKPSIQFVKNMGQWDSEIRFKADIAGGYLFVKQNSLHYVFYDTKALSDLHNGKNTANAKINNQIKAHGVEVEFVASNVNPNIIGQKENQAHFNYFLGSDPTKWQKDVPTFDEVYLKEIYPNIDLRLYSFDQSLKYEYVVKPKADISKIRMKYKGIEQIMLENQQVRITTSINTIKELEPFTFQKINGKNQEVKSKYRLENNEISFQIGDYDTSKELVIDPQLVFSTYSGATSDNWAHTATYDSEGNLYAGGSVFGSGFPITTGAFQVNLGGAASATSVSSGITDIVIMKFSSNGQQLLYATFIGGVDTEVPHSLIVNSKSELVIFGTTSSTNFPLVNPFQRNFVGGVPYVDATGIGFGFGSDIFVSVLSKDGKKMIGSTLLGGNGNDGYNNTSGLEIRNYGDEFRGEVVVDEADNIYVSSITTSTNFPLKNAIQSARASSYDAVAFKLNPDCSQLLFSTYIGGNGFDAGYGIKVSKSGSFYICGTSQSTTLAAKAGALHGRNNGNIDGFIAKFSKDYLLEQITFIGTNKADIAYFIDLDAEDNVHVFGQTRGDYPVSAGVYQNAQSGQFIDCLDKNLSRRVFSTVIGTKRAGEVDIVPTAFLINRCGNIYLAGWGGKVNHRTGFNEKSTTTGLPITADAYQKTTTGNNYYIMILEKGAKALMYATFFGASAPPTPEGEVGDHLDGGTCRFDKNGIIYHSACACKARQGTAVATFPTLNAWQKEHRSSNCNLAAFKFDIDALKANFEITDGTKKDITEVCIPSKLNFNNLSTGAKTYRWFIDGKVLSNAENVVGVNFNTLGEYKVKLVAYNNTNCIATDSTEKIIKTRGFVSTARGDTTVCSDVEAKLYSFGPSDAKYSWLPTTGLSNPNIPNPTTKINTTTKYTVSVTKDGCEVKNDVTIKIDDAKPDFVVSGGNEICKGQSLMLTASGKAKSITWSAPDMQDSTKKSIIVKPTKTTVYTAKANYDDGCKPSRSLTVTIDESYKPSFEYSTTQECNKPLVLTFTNTTNGAERFVWLMGNGDSLSNRTPDNFKYTKAGNYSVTLKSYNKIGCELVTSKTISIPDSDGKVPNVITPNGDGKNDVFVIGIPNSTLQIFNRNGKLIYESKNYQNDWGDGVMNGTYYYLITTPLGEECKGFITVLTSE
ncbi:MAG: gliding motility-associated C-terminal domain-containing protein [Spirosomaceae bacterium]|nr:gliding motility-associated C-terminal domain-containing protein [Spirosomataceae bacterium]